MHELFNSNTKMYIQYKVVFLSNSTTIPLSNLLNLNPLQAVLNQSFYNVCLAKRIHSGNPLFGPQNSQNSQNSQHTKLTTHKTHKTHKTHNTQIFYRVTIEFVHWFIHFQLHQIVCLPYTWFRGLINDLTE